MFIHFSPSLQQIAYVRVAQGILYTFDLEILKKRSSPYDIFRFSHFKVRIEKMVSDIVMPTFPTNLGYFSTMQSNSEQIKDIVLPPDVQTLLVGTVIKLYSDMKKWFRCHSSILHDEDLNLRDRLNWYSFGIINRFKTAETFIHDESVNIKDRFELACMYFFEDVVHMLWRTMSVDDRSSFQKCRPRTTCMELWLDVLKGTLEMDWEQILLEVESDFFYRNYWGMRYYFPKVRSRKMRYCCIFYALGSQRLHNFDLYSCLSRMKDYELNVMLCTLPMIELIRLFQCFLDWPFQIIFLDVVDKFKRHIHEEIFISLTETIEYKVSGKKYLDYPYKNLLERFRNLAPLHFKNYVRKDEKLIGTFENISVSRTLEMIYT